MEMRLPWLDPFGKSLGTRFSDEYQCVPIPQKHGLYDKKIKDRRSGADRFCDAPD